MLEFLVRFLVGGVVVSAFAVLGDVLKPKSFAGLFGAAPSVALGTLGLTIHANGNRFAAAESRSMIAGALAFCLYAYISSRALARGRFGAAAVSIGALSVWLVASLSAWFLVLRR
jgi:Protein of unknown function (DUF3147)